MNIRQIIAAAGASFFCAASGSALGGDASSSEPWADSLAHTCAACHGTFGEVKGENFVPLAGMPPAEFIISMKDFKNLKRPSSIMSHIAQGYGDDEIERMADFFANIKTGEQK